MPDFRLAVNPPSDVQGFGLFGALRKYSYMINTQDNSVIIRDVCQSSYTLGSIPATIYLFGIKNPEVAKSLDPIRIRIWQGAGEIAELPLAKSPTFQITVGSISGVSLATKGGAVQINKVTDVTVNFRFQHQAVTDASLSTFPARIEFTFTDLDFKIDPYMVVSDTSVPGSTVEIESVDTTKNKAIVKVSNPMI
jgi:hypothetical protein